MSADRSNLQGSNQESGESAQPGTPSSKAGAKPRASRAGTRSVSTLNAAQLERKRANDREAQRAIRQRTKDHIERLERRIQELSGEDESTLESHPAFQEARKRNAELEAELRRLQATLYGSEERASSPDASYSDAGYGTPVRDSTSYGNPWASQTVSQPGYAPTSVPVAGPAPPPTPAWAPQVTSYTSSGTSSPYQAVPHVLPSQRGSLSGSQYGSESGGGTPDPLQSYNTSAAAQPEQQHSYSSGRADYVWTAPDNPPPAPMTQGQMGVLPNPVLQNLSAPYASGSSLNVWELQVRFSLPSSPSSASEHLVPGMIQHLKGLRAKGVTGEALVGPLEPNLGLVVQQGYSNAVHALTHTISEMVIGIPFRGFVEKIGILVLVYPVFQWLIANTYETYARLPSHYTPLPCQLQILHPIWTSMIPWPKLREKVITNQEIYATTEFEQLHGASLILNWPFQAQNAIEAAEGGWRATEAFTAYARDLQNWSLGDAFSRRYPELRELCRFADP